MEHRRYCSIKPLNSKPLLQHHNPLTHALFALLSYPSTCPNTDNLIIFTTLTLTPYSLYYWPYTLPSSRHPFKTTNPYPTPSPSTCPYPAPVAWAPPASLGATHSMCSSRYQATCSGQHPMSVSPTRTPTLPSYKHWHPGQSAVHLWHSSFLIPFACEAYHNLSI